MKAFLAIFAVGLSSQVMADQANLGSELPLRVEGEKAKFGAVYTYGEDLDPPTYQLTYGVNLDQADLLRKLRWNFYTASTSSYLLDWSTDRQVLLAPSIQIKFEEAETSYAGIVANMLAEQAKAEGAGQLYIVFADEANTPVYYIPVSDLCRKFPTNFKDLTYGKACDQPVL